MGAVAVGDSHAFLAGPEQARELTPHPGDETLYLGNPALSRERIEAGVRVEIAETASCRALVLVSDGLSETGIGVEDPANAVMQAVRDAAGRAADLRPLEAARNIVRRALTSHRENRSGDNAAAAVLWLD